MQAYTMPADELALMASCVVSCRNSGRYGRPSLHLGSVSAVVLLFRSMPARKRPRRFMGFTCGLLSDCEAMSFRIPKDGVQEVPLLVLGVVVLLERLVLTTRLGLRVPQVSAVVTNGLLVARCIQDAVLAGLEHLGLSADAVDDGVLRVSYAPAVLPEFGLEAGCAGIED